MKNITIFTFHDTSSAYSCLLYLKKVLEKEYNVNIWSFTPKKKINDNNSYTFESRWYGNIRYFRIFLSHIDVLLMMLFSKKELFIINDLDFFIPAYIVKKLKKNVKIIHYNTEIHGEDVKYPNYITKFYKKHAGFPDMIIECLQERADYRRKTFNITKDIYVINNTIPKSYIDEICLKEIDTSEYLNFQRNYPILIYAGGCDLSRKLGDIINCIPNFDKKINFVFFCHGTEKDFQLVEKQISKFSKYENWRLYKSVSKDILLNVMADCDIGVSYYDPNISINHYYASPSKIFEYLGVGLSVLSSNNEGMNRIILSNNLGYCLNNDETIENGINNLLLKGLQNKDLNIKIFNDTLCYEKDSKETINLIKKIMDE